MGFNSGFKGLIHHFDLRSTKAAGRDYGN